MAYLKLCLWKEAAADATDVLEREPHNVKALLRRAAAAEAQGAPAAAVTDLRTVLQLQPANAEAVSRLAVLEQQQQQAGTAGSCGSCCSDAAACGGAAAPV
jgi:RNA polymerase II-associated protein 3